jgi:hypothetical protein
MFAVRLMLTFPPPAETRLSVIIRSCMTVLTVERIVCQCLVHLES